MKTIPIIQARKRLTSLPEEFEKEPQTGAVAVTRRGKPVLAVMSWDLYEAISETLEIMGDQVLMNALAKSIKDIESGKTLSSAEVARLARL
ncbi:MAG: type II toxin-antitoxin system Phd/YefM family antitoxin [Nitrospinae bacterium]|nr:type II toxin-antitoxin system Phd/YefM family antitoxin [Nitrospinota bacterium]